MIMDKYVKEYIGDLIARASRQSPEQDYFTQHKKRNQKIFNEIGLPASRMEAWKHTDIEKKLHTTLSGIREKDTPKSAFSYFSFWENCYRIVISNGVLQKEESSSQFPDGVIVCSFQEALEAGNIAFAGKYNTITDDKEHLSVINSAVTDDGLFVYIPPDLLMDKPVHLIHRTDRKGLINSRILIDISSGSQCVLLEMFQSEQQGNYVNNTVSEVFVDPYASLNHYCIQMSTGSGISFQGLNIMQNKNSSYHHFSMTLPGCDLTRNNIHARMVGKDATNNLSGLFFGVDKYLIDNHTLVEHIASDCKSDEMYRGIIHDSSTGIFDGRVIVHPQAQKTVAYQQNKNLILSDDAHIYTNPQLEIFADDVICTHGATIGELDKRSLFYLQSRGIREETALRLLTEAFVFDVISRIPDADIRDYIRELAAANLRDLHHRKNDKKGRNA